MRDLSFDSSRVFGTLDAWGLRCNGTLFLREAFFERGMDLSDATVSGSLYMTGSSFGGTLDASGLSVGNGLFLSGGANFKDVILAGANVSGPLDMSGSSFAGPLKAQALSAGGVFLMARAKFNADVVLSYATVSKVFNMTGSSVEGTLAAGDLSVGGSLFMDRGAKFEEVDLMGAKVAGHLDMTGSSFNGPLKAYYLSVGGDLVWEAANFRYVDLYAAKADELSLFEATANGIELTGSDIAGQLSIASLGWHCYGDDLNASPIHWVLNDKSKSAECKSGAPWMALRNAHVGNLQDTDDAWPPALDLEGFRYERLGGRLSGLSDLLGAGFFDMRRRSAKKWIAWLERDHTFSTQPYVQLASVLLTAGHRGAAERIQYAERSRERKEAWLRGDWLQWGWLVALCLFVGYGIGLYTFYVLGWVIGLTLLGAAVLRYCPEARHHSLLWHIGASLHRLLPVVGLSKQFQDFFDDPRNLTRFQAVFFAGLAIAGWVLGFPDRGDWWPYAEGLKRDHLAPMRMTHDARRAKRQRLAMLTYPQPPSAQHYGV